MKKYKLNCPDCNTSITANYRFVECQKCRNIIDMKTGKLKCTETVLSRGRFNHNYRCSRNVWKDKKCKQHHPSTVVARRKKSDELWESRRKTRRAPFEKIQKLTREIKKLKTALKKAGQELYIIEVLDPDMKKHLIGKELEFASEKDWIDSRIREWYPGW